MVVRVRKTLHLLLNGVELSLENIPADQTLLDFLRLERKLTGSKEGCAEGDCGACSVLVGRLLDGELVYEVVNACIRFMGSLDGCHVVTIEHLQAPDGALHPVQKAMVDYHGSQCGFCTPGIVMSLYGLWMQNPEPSVDDIEVALQGNLCRCTGYAPIVRAAQAIVGSPAEDALVTEREEVNTVLRSMNDGRRLESGPEDNHFISPAHYDDFVHAMLEYPDATVVAGSTDVGLWVTKFMKNISPVIFMSNLPELQTIEVTDDALVLGAGVTYAQAEPYIAEYFPAMHDLWKRIGGAQVRYMGTIGGNIANGSPIGDTPPPLIALGASITLRKGDERREVKLEDYFIAYGEQDIERGEFIESITIPKLGAGEYFAVYKISKRRDEDISSVCAAFRAFADEGVVEEISIAFGGMAATPKRARAAEAAFLGKVGRDEETIDAVIAALSKDYQPISDMRASADYRMLVAQNLVRRFVAESVGNTAQLKRGVA